MSRSAYFFIASSEDFAKLQVNFLVLIPPEGWAPDDNPLSYGMLSEISKGPPTETNKKLTHGLA